VKKTLVITWRLDMVLRLVDTSLGRVVSLRDLAVYADELRLKFLEKDTGTLIFQGLPKRQFQLRVVSAAYETAELPVDLDQLDKQLPLLDVHLIPKEKFPGGVQFLTVEGNLPGIRELSAVRKGDNSCMAREFDPRRRLLQLSNPRGLLLDRVYYAIIDPDQDTCEPIQIMKMVDKQTAKLKTPLQKEFKIYFPICPVVFGKTSSDGHYCLRVRDDGLNAQWLLRWVVGDEEFFKTVDFREEENPVL